MDQLVWHTPSRDAQALCRRAAACDQPPAVQLFGERDHQPAGPPTLLKPGSTILPPPLLHPHFPLPLLSSPCLESQRHVLTPRHPYHRRSDVHTSKAPEANNLPSLYLLLPFPRISPSSPPDQTYFLPRHQLHGSLPYLSLSCDCPRTRMLPPAIFLVAAKRPRCNRGNALFTQMATRRADRHDPLTQAKGKGHHKRGPRGPEADDN